MTGFARWSLELTRPGHPFRAAIGTTFEGAEASHGAHSGGGFALYDVMMRIEELDTSHSPLVTALWDIVGLTRAWNDPHVDFVRALGGLTSTVLGAFDGDDLVGTVMVGYDGHRGWIYYLAVAPECQHTGVGTSLMKAGEHWLREHGAVKVQLMVRKANHQVTGFYEHLGYEESPTTVFARWLHEVS